MSRCSWAERSFHGTLSDTLNFLATVSRTSINHDIDGPRVQPESAPWLMLNDGSGTTASGSTSMRMPSPVQTVQAPCGLLNEKLRGAGSSMDMPQYTHAKSFENSISPSSDRGAMRPPRSTGIAGWTSPPTRGAGAPTAPTAAPL